MKQARKNKDKDLSAQRGQGTKTYKTLSISLKTKSSVHGALIVS